MSKEKVILDIEFAQTRGLAELKFETLEIGAVKLDSDNQIVDEFDYLFIPEYAVGYEIQFDRLMGRDGYCKNSDITSFPEGIKALCSWIGDNPLTVYTWGQNDLRILVDEILAKCTREEIDFLSPYFMESLDLQFSYARLFNCVHAPRLRKAVCRCGFDFSGEEHFALDDAMNTAKVYCKLEASHAFEGQYAMTYSTKFNCLDLELYEAEEQETASFASFLSPELLSRFGGGYAIA